MVSKPKVPKSRRVPPARVEEARIERAFWDDHYDEFVRLYPEHFVGVKDSEVVAAATALREFVALVEAKGLKPRDLWLEYVRSKPMNYIL